MSKQTKKSDSFKNVTLVEIARSIKMNPKDARRHVRASDRYTKRKDGWVFPVTKRKEIVNFLRSKAA